MSQLYLITGPRGAGKTTWCTDLVRCAAENDLSQGGFLSPAIFEGGEKIGIDLLDIRTDQQRPLARCQSENATSILMGDWCFDPVFFEWGNQILKALTSNDLIIIDEIGPLEFERGNGFVEGLRLVDEKRYQKAFVVIRPELLEVAKERWPEAEVVDVASGKPTPHLLERNTA